MTKKLFNIEIYVSTMAVAKDADEALWLMERLIKKGELTAEFAANMDIHQRHITSAEHLPNGWGPDDEPWGITDKKVRDFLKDDE